MIPLKQSTEKIILIGPFLDKTDGVTEEAGLAGTATEISKNGGAFAAGPNLGTHDSDGWYPITLTTTHTNTVGPLPVKVHDAATHCPVWVYCWVYPANVYDSLFTGSDKLDTGAAESVTGAVGSVTGAVGSVTGAVGSVTGNVGGNVNGNVVGTVGSIASPTTGHYV